MARKSGQQIRHGNLGTSVILLLFLRPVFLACGKRQRQKYLRSSRASKSALSNGRFKYGITKSYLLGSNMSKRIENINTRFLTFDRSGLTLRISAQGGVLTALDGIGEREKVTLKKNAEVKATSISGLSAMYGVSASMIERAITSGELPVSRLRRRVIIRIEDAERWIGKSRRKDA